MLRLWSKDDPVGIELVDIVFGDTTLTATGLAIGTFTRRTGAAEERAPYRADYRLTTLERYVTSRLVVRTHGEGWYRTLDLRRLADGMWQCTSETVGDVDLPPPGGDLAVLRDAADCDLAFSPLTNALPVLRHGIHEGGDEVEIAVAWVGLPDLSVHRDRQRYSFVRKEGATRVVRFEGLEEPFTADIVMDEHALVIDYPGIARRVT